MKLFHLILGRMSAALIVILTLWAGLFYLAVMEEVNDEVDDSLEDYSEALILRWLSGEELPARSNGSNNQYFLYEVSESYARMYPRISYHDEMVYITEKDEEEPARVLTTIFEAEGNRFMELVVYGCSGEICILCTACWPGWRPIGSAVRMLHWRIIPAFMSSAS